MIKKLLSSFVLLAVVVFAWQALAEEGTSVSPIPTHKDVKEMKKEMKSEIKDMKKEVRMEIKEKKIEFKQDLRKVKDQKKKDAVGKIMEELVKLNSKTLKHFENSLDKLEKVLSRTLEKADKRAQKGFNIDRVKAAAEEARAAMVASRAAIEVQKSKVYKIEAPSEEGLKDAVKQARQALRDDLKMVQNTVKTAREAVQKVTVALAKIRKNGKATPEPSPSPSVSPLASPSASPSVTP